MANNKKFDIDNIKINLKNTQKKHTESTKGARTGGSINGYKIPKLTAKQKYLLEKTSKKYGIVIPSYTELRKMAANPEHHKTLGKTLMLRYEMSTPHILYDNLSEYDYRKRAIFRANLPTILAKLGLYSNNININNPDFVDRILSINIFKYDYSNNILNVIHGYENLNKIRSKGHIEEYQDELKSYHYGSDKQGPMFDAIKDAVEEADKYFSEDELEWGLRLAPSEDYSIDEFQDYIKSIEKYAEHSEYEINKHNLKYIKEELHKQRKLERNAELKQSRYIKDENKKG